MKVKIEENWKAIEDAEKAVQEKTGDPEAGFNASTFWLGNGCKPLMIPCQYRKKKGKKGQETFTQSHKEIMVTAEYCPFTGKPLYKETGTDSTF